MRRSVSTRLAGIAVVCLVGSGLSGCCKSYVQAQVEPCPPMSAELLMHILDGGDVADVYVADEIIPYCAGIKAVNE